MALREEILARDPAALAGEDLAIYQIVKAMSSVRVNWHPNNIEYLRDHTVDRLSDICDLDPIEEDDSEED